MVDTTFHVNDVSGRGYRMWDDDDKKFLFADVPIKGYAPYWKVKTDKGMWYASAGQYSQLLLGAEKGGMADILDKTFTYASNNKSGVDVRYFFNLQDNA